MTVTIAPPMFLQFQNPNNSGSPAAGFKLFTYIAGTSTKQATWTDSTQTVQNPNPLPLDSNGVGNFWGDPTLAFKFVWAPANDTDPPTSPVRTVDNLYFPLSLSALTQQVIGAILYPATSAEISAGVTPKTLAYEPLDSRRYNFDLAGNTNNTTLLQAVLNAAGLAAAATGQVNEVSLWPGIYLINRVYLNYSNVNLRISGGAVIKQTLTGITNSNTTGQVPAYAVIHINPLAYVSNPASGAAGTINNVRIYGGGTVQGPYSSTHAYDGFTLGVVSNDCHKFWVEGILVQGCGGENILLNPSAWTTCTDLRVIGNEINQGGEVGINNARDFLMLNNYQHDSWSQNGMGAGGDGGLICFNRVRGMAGNGMSVGGSGAKDINAVRNVILGYNSITNTNVTSGGGYSIFLTDDGATTTPKIGVKVIGNLCNLNQSGTGAMFGADYAMASGFVEVEHNFFTGGTAAGSTAAMAIISGSARYDFRDNSAAVGAGNLAVMHDILGGTPVANIWSFDNRDLTTDIGHVSLWNIVDVQRILSGLLTLTGCTTAPTTTYRAVKRGKSYIMEIDGVAATSNATTCTLTGLPTELFPSRNVNYRFPVIDNGVNVDGLLQITAVGAVTLFKDINASAFTNAGTKGLPGPYSVSVQMT